MKIGIKIGPKNWKKALSETKAKYCEVWFRLNRVKEYTPLFECLNKNKISFGLHFWAMIQGKYLPSLLYSKNDIAAETFRAIKKTINIASQWRATYVNFHPDSYRLTVLDLDNLVIKTLDSNELIERKKSFDQLLYYLQNIRIYADKKRVISFSETVPKFLPSDPENVKTGRLNIQKSEGLETERFFKLAKLGYPVCFDIGHTTGQLITNDRKKLFDYLYTSAKKMLPGIGLVHVTTTIPPFNGTDSHNGILKKDFKKGVLPDRRQLIKLLSLFKRKDVWLIPEPEIGDMAKNYFELKELVKKIQ